MASSSNILNQTYIFPNNYMVREMLRQDEYSGTTYRLDYITENYNDRVANADLTPMDTSYYTSYRPSFEMDTPETVGGFVITDFCQTASYCVLPDYDAIACSLDCPQP